LIFAPPGTLLFIGVLLVSLTSNIWVVLGGSCFLILAGLIFLIRRWRNNKN
jgi:LPXTG-motif cell wall-anchored protein